LIKNGNEIIKIKYDGAKAYRVYDDTLENKKIDTILLKLKI
jgi:hypothetical protein